VEVEKYSLYTFKSVREILIRSVKNRKSMGHQLYLMYVPRRFVVETYAVNGEDLGERNYSTYREKT